MPTPTSEASAEPAEPAEPVEPEESEKEKVVVRIRTKQLKASVKRPEGGDGPSEEGRKKKAKKRKVIESDDSFEEEESLPDEDDYASLEEDESQLPVCFTGSSLSSFRMAKQRPDKKFIKSSMPQIEL